MAINWTEIDRLVRALKQTTEVLTEEDVLRQLRTWWCLKYNRPFKDPLLNTYTLDELVYEYLTHYYFDPENDPSKQDQKKSVEKDDEEWIKKQLENINKTDSTPESPPKVEPPKDQELPDLPELSTKFEG